MKPFHTLLLQNSRCKAEQAAQRLLRLAPGHAEAILRAAALKATEQEQEAFRQRQAHLLYEHFHP